LIRSVHSRLLLLCLVIPHTTCAVAGDIEGQLAGAWAEVGADCKDVFVSEAGKWKFREPRDMYGTSFIVTGRQIEGPFGLCRLSSITQRDDKAFLRLSCNNSVGFSDQVTPIRLNSSTELERFFPAVEGITVKYQRCQP
jgi:hypothetical protein